MLNVVDVERPTPGPDQVLVRVKAAGIIQERHRSARACCTSAGPPPSLRARAATWPAWWKRLARRQCLRGRGRSHRVDGRRAGARPSSWCAGRPPGRHAGRGCRGTPPGALFVAGVTAWAAVRAVACPARRYRGDLRRCGRGRHRSPCSWPGMRERPRLSAWPAAPPRVAHEHGVIPVTYGDGVEDRIRELAGGAVDAFVDTFGGGYVELAIELGVRRSESTPSLTARPPRIRREDRRSSRDASPEVLAQLAALIDGGRSRYRSPRYIRSI